MLTITDKTAIVALCSQDNDRIIGPVQLSSLLLVVLKVHVAYLANIGNSVYTWHYHLSVYSVN